MWRKLRMRGGKTVVLVAITAIGCGGMQPAANRDSGSVSAPGPWASSETATHLRYLAGREAEGRATGSPGFGHAASYVEARLREYGLQPVAPRSWRHLFFTPLNALADARVIRYAADTLVFSRSSGVVPDPRSASGTVGSGTLDVVLRTDDVPADLSPVVVAGPAFAGDARLESLEAKGARAVILAAPAVFDRAARPLGSLLVVRADSGVVGTITGVGPGADGAAGRLGADVLVEVAGSFDPSGAAMNVMGYVVGRDPHRSSELVLVTSALDGRGRVVGQATEEPDEASVAASALLEAARVLADLARAGRGPDRTVLFAFLAGARQGDSGARAWIRNPTWPADAVKAVLRVDAAGEGPFAENGYPARTMDAHGAASHPAGPADGAAALAREILLAVADDLWLREGSSRVPPAGDRR